MIPRCLYCMYDYVGCEAHVTVKTMCTLRSPSEAKLQYCCCCAAHTDARRFCGPPNLSTSPTNMNLMASYYNQDVDFDKLAEKDPDFAAICKVSKDKKWIDFKDAKVVQ